MIGVFISLAIVVSCCVKNRRRKANTKPQSHTYGDDTATIYTVITSTHGDLNGAGVTHTIVWGGDQ